MQRHRLTFSTAMMTSALFGAPALAQTLPPPGPPAPTAAAPVAGPPAGGGGAVPLANTQGSTASAPAGTALSEIVVTAERRETTAQRTAASLDVVTSAVLENQKVLQLQDLNQVLPSVQIVPFVNSVQFSIRGVSSDFVDPRADPAVAASLNGLFFDRPLPFGFAFLDVARVEDLNGPQGTLYGRNAAGGAINLVTNQPSQKFGGMIEAGGGNYGENDVNGVVNLPVTDTFALRLAYARDRRDGYIGNYYDDINSDTGRFEAKWRPTDKLTIYGEYDYEHQGGHGGIQEYYPCNGAQPWSLTIPAGCASLLRGKAGVIPTNGRTGTHIDAAQVHVDYDLGFATASAITGFVGTHQRFDNLPNGVLLNTSGIDNLDYTEELRLAGHDSASHKGGFAWQTGTFLFASDGQFGQHVFTPIGTSSTVFTSLPQSSEAAFAQATYGVTDRLRLTGGVRYTHDQKILSGFAQFNTAVVAKTPRLQADDYRTTYKGGIEYDLAARNLLYANIASGYVAGGPDGGNAALPTPAAISPVIFLPETIKSYEIGSKNRFFDNRLQLNGDFYYYYANNVQISQSNYLNNVPAVPPNFTLVVENIGSISSYGLETNATFALTKDDQLSASVTYAQGTYGGSAYRARSSTFTPTLFPIPAGSPIINLPDWTALLGYEHTWELPGDTSLAFSVNAKLSTRYHLVIASSSPYDIQPGYSQTDMSLAYTFGDGRYTIRGYAKNLEDTAVNVYGQAPGSFVYAILPPRTYGGTVSAKF